MTIDSLIHTRLSGDATLIALLTGGVYLSRSLPRRGITRDDLDAAWMDSETGALKPLAVVKPRSVVATSDVKDQTRQLTSTAQVIEIWMYADGDAGFATLESAANRIYTLLQERRVTGTFSLTFDQQLYPPRASELGDAGVIRLDYLAIAYKGTLS
jgi:hypothetical protein